VKKLTGLIHSLYCYEDHNIDMENVNNNKDKCTFFLENSLEGTWNRPAHKKWLEKVTNLVNSLDLTKDESEEFVLKAIRLVGPLQHLIMTDDSEAMENRCKFIAGLLNPHEMKLS